MQALISTASGFAPQILEKKRQDIRQDMQSDSLPLAWKPDLTRSDSIYFMGYEAGRRTSEVTAQPRLFYDHNKPFQRNVRYEDYFIAEKDTRIPRAYVIPQGWHEVIDLLKLNGVTMRHLSADSVIRVEAYHIGHYQSSARPYEKHHRNSAVQVNPNTLDMQFLKGDYFIDTRQPARRFLFEMLEPAGDDSYFAWNFFDAILQQKEGYSDYRWEDLAATWIKEHPECAAALARKKEQDTAFAKNAHAQLEFVYHCSPYWEPAFLRYPVYRLL
jgi:hypothetical protein